MHGSKRVEKSSFHSIPSRVRSRRIAFWARPEWTNAAGGGLFAGQPRGQTIFDSFEGKYAVQILEIALQRTYHVLYFFESVALFRRESQQ